MGSQFWWWGGCGTPHACFPLNCFPFACYVWFGLLCAASLGDALNSWNGSHGTPHVQWSRVSVNGISNRNGTAAAAAAAPLNNKQCSGGWCLSRRAASLRQRRCHPPHHHNAGRELLALCLLYNGANLTPPRLLARQCGIPNHNHLPRQQARAGSADYSTLLWCQAITTVPSHSMPAACAVPAVPAQQQQCFSEAPYRRVSGLAAVSEPLHHHP